MSGEIDQQLHMPAQAGDTRTDGVCLRIDHVAPAK
jgi:hypothetical protein